MAHGFVRPALYFALPSPAPSPAARWSRFRFETRVTCSGSGSRGETKLRRGPLFSGEASQFLGGVGAVEAAELLVQLGGVGAIGKALQQAFAVALAAPVGRLVAIAVFGGIRVASGQMSLGDVQAFIQYSRQFTMPITQIASVANLLQSGAASAERVFELLDELRELIGNAYGPELQAQLQADQITEEEGFDDDLDF